VQLALTLRQLECAHLVLLLLLLQYCLLFPAVQHLVLQALPLHLLPRKSAHGLRHCLLL
jgi:hypothetical protein